MPSAGACGEAAPVNVRRAAQVILATLFVAGCDPLLPPQASLLGSDAGADAGTDAAVDDSDAGPPSIETEAADAGFAPDGSAPFDAGDTASDDAGNGELDAGTSWPDAGVALDAGLTEPDAGVPEPDAGVEAVDAGPLPIGGGCGDASDCSTGMCYTNAPGGYCTQACGGGCPSGSTCDYGLGGYCVQGCQSNSDCRDGYTCQYQLGGRACLVAYCFASWQCPGNLVCNTSVGACFSPCHTPSDCPNPSSETCDTAQSVCGPL
jgi:hypothetical protein